MAPGTPHGQAEHGRGGGGQHVIHRVIAGPLHFIGRDLRGEHARSEKPGRHQSQRIFGREFIARQLPLHELVVGHVGIERLDDKVPIVVGPRAIVIMLKTGTFGEAGHVQPVPGPALSVLRLGEQAVDGPFPRTR